MKRKPRMPLLSVVAIVSIVQVVFGRSEAVSTGNGADSPWLWVSEEDGTGVRDDTRASLLEMVEYIEDPHSADSSLDLKSEPRFIGHLKRKLCRVGLGVGKMSPLCVEEKISTKGNRVKRSPQFIRVSDDHDRNDKDDSSSIRLFGGGNGLDGLLNPHISPSVGLHFGGYPYGYGYHGGHGGHGGHRGPFQFDLGPFSINPFGGLRFSLRDGRPHIRPTLDFLVTPNNNDFDHPPYQPYNPYYPYHNRPVRAAAYHTVNGLSPFHREAPFLPLVSQHKSAPFEPSFPLKRTTPTVHSDSTTLFKPYQKTQHHSSVYFPVNKQVDELDDTNLHEAPQPRLIKTIGNILSKLPLDISFGLPKNPPASPLSFSPVPPSVPGIHSLPGIQHPLVTPLHPLRHLALANTLSSSPLLHHPLITQAAVQKYGNPLSPVGHPTTNIPPVFPPPLSPGPISLYLDFSPDSREKVGNKRKRHPIVTDLHDKPKPTHYPTHYPSNGRPSRPTTNPCYYISCRELSFYCSARFKNRRHSRQIKGRFNTNQLPFTCGLHEICCNVDEFGSSFNPVGVAVPSASSRTCGRSTVSNIKGRISSGSREKGEAKFGEFPWQAAILKKEGKDNIYVCAGSLIDRSHVLTAAHCVEGYAAEHLRIRLGEWDVNRDTEFYAHLEYDVVGVAVHPDFYSGNLINDIAILRMLYPVDISNTPHVSPICLPAQKISFAGNRCWVSGWGKDAFGKKGKYQNLLKKIDIPVLPRHACQDILTETRLGPDYSLHPGMMCAGGEPEKDACKGDGGGPLSCRDVDGNFVLSGIVSWGIGCGQPGIPGIYVNVEYYVGWIRKMMES